MNPADPHMQRPCHSPFFVLITPCGNEIRFDQLERIVRPCGCGNVATPTTNQGSPAGGQVPRMGHVERWWRDGREGKFECRVSLLNEPPLRRPIGPDDIRIEVMDYRIDCRRDRMKLIAPDGDEIRPA